MSGAAGLRPLLKASMEVDRLRIAPWIGLITALSVSSVIGFPLAFPDPADRAELAATIAANPALSLLFGPARDLSGADGFNAWRAGLLGAFFAGLMGIFIVVRNSRAQEDSGQAELIAAAPVGRRTRLAVAVAMALIASALLMAVSTIATTLFGGGLADTAALAATWGASGAMFAGVAAVAAQLGSDARAATTMSVAVLGVIYIGRGFIDASGAPDWMVWLTPLGWLEKVEPASGNDLRPLLAALAFAGLGIAAAFVLQRRRDYGMGLIPPRAGPDRAGLVRTVPGLVLRLNRPSLIAWLVAFAALGGVFGVLATSIVEVFADNPAIASALGAGRVTKADLLFAFLITIISLVGIIAAVFGVGIVMRGHAEEVEGRTDPLLAGSVSRPRLFATGAVIALVATALAMLIAGGIIGAVASSREPDIDAREVLAQAAATVPAVWLLVGIALAAVGARPALRFAAWAGIVATFAVSILGPLFRLPDWVLAVSPMWHVPDASAAAPSWLPLLGLLLIAAALLGIGLAGYRRRDLA